MSKGGVVVVGQKTTDWRPTAKQLDLLIAARKPGLKRSITAICDEAGVHRTRFYDWMRDDPDFKDAWVKIWQDMLDLHTGGLMAAMIQKGLAGNVGAARLVLEIKGLIKKRVEVTGNEGGPVQTLDLSKLTPAQLDVLITLDPALMAVLGGTSGEVVPAVPAEALPAGPTESTSKP